MPAVLDAPGRVAARKGSGPAHKRAGRRAGGGVEAGPSGPGTPVFPPIRFPGGVSAPVVVLLVALLLVAVVAAVLVRSPGVRTVSSTVVAAQRATATTFSAALADGARQAMDQVEASVRASGAEQPTATAERLVRTVGGLRAASVVDRTSNQVLARRGSPPPADGLPLGQPMLQVLGPAQAPRAVVVVPAGNARLVVAAVDLVLPPLTPDAPFGQHAALVTALGQVLTATGKSPVGSQARQVALVARSAAEAARLERSDLVDQSTLLDTGRDPSLPALSTSATAVPLPALPGSARVSVVVVAATPPLVGARGFPGALWGIGLAVLAVGGFLVLRRGLVDPVRRLREDVDALAAPGGAAVAPRRSRIREVDVIAEAAGVLHSGSTTPAPGRRRLHPGVLSARLLVVVVCFSVTAWLVAMVAATGGEPGLDADAHVTDVRGLVSSAGDDLRRHLDDGGSRVAAAAAPQLGDVGGGDLAARVTALATLPDLFRAVYVLDPTGTVVFSVGRPPLRTTEPIPAANGVSQLNTAGRLPVVAAHAATPDGSRTVVAEYDVAALSATLRKLDTHVRVVDPRRLTVLDSDGFRAFTPLADADLQSAADAASRGQSFSQSATIDGDDSAIAALPVGDRDAAAELRWSILGTQPVSAIDFRHDSATRALLVVAGLGIAVALVVLTWTWLLVLGPLRRAGAFAECLRNGERPKESVAPERLDEVGAVVADLARFGAVKGDPSPRANSDSNLAGVTRPLRLSPMPGSADTAPVRSRKLT